MNKKLLIISVVALTVLVVGASTAFAFGGTSNYDTLQNLTGLSDEEITAEREAGNRMGDIARDKGVFDAFQAKKIDTVKDLVKEGELTQEEGDAIIERLEDCDGTGSNRENGLCPTEGMRIFSRGQGQGQGRGMGQGRGRGFCGN